MNEEQIEIVTEFEKIANNMLAGVDSKLSAFRVETQRTIKERTARVPAAIAGFNTDRAIESPGARFVSSSEFQTWSSSPGQRGRVTLAAPFTKATALTNATVSPRAARIGEIMPMPTLPPAVVELVNWRPIGSGSTVEYLRESARVAPGAKSQLGEGALKAEQTVAVELIAQAIQTIAAWTSVSTQALADTSQLMRFIDEVLTASVLAEIDRQVLNGIGDAANELVGIVPNAVPYNVALTVTGDGPLDIISHAQAQLYASGVVATAVVLSPADAELVRLVKDVNGTYLWGAPAAGAPASVWGLVPVVDANLASGFLVGDFTGRSIELLLREEILTELSREHADYFTKNMCAIRTEARAANGLYRPSAFVTGTFPATPPATLAANRK